MNKLMFNDTPTQKVALRLPIGSLETRFVLEPVPECEPSTYQAIRDSFGQVRFDLHT